MVKQSQNPWEVGEDIVEHLGDLETFRARVRERRGAWADDFSLGTVRDYLGLAAILLIDVEGKKGQKFDRVRV
jgi:hypothetical protein